ncbi:MAG: Arm DNA-binding domain-containing protein [Phycisphaerales bacterium]|nr:Arm DNA-binding domain-containing protein [Phycisphaerales bacterium]
MASRPVAGGVLTAERSNGGRYWRYNYRFDGRQKTLALAIHPDVSLDKARARHQVARTLLAAGIAFGAEESTGQLRFRDTAGLNRGGRLTSA